MKRNEKQAEFIKRFIDNLGDVKNWEHKGEVVELPTVSGTCVCGHSIKFLYYIEEKNTHRKEVLGSECINNFKDYSPELYEALATSKVRFDESKKAEKYAEIDAEIAQLKNKFDSLVEEYKNRKIYNSNVEFFIKKDFGSRRKTIKERLENAIPIIEKYIASVNRCIELNKMEKEIDERIKKLNSEKFNIYAKYLGSEMRLNALENFESGKLEIPNYYEYSVFGDTYYHKGGLKAQGFQWNGIGKYWGLMSNKKIEVAIPKKDSIKVVERVIDK